MKDEKMTLLKEFLAKENVKYPNDENYCRYHETFEKVIENVEQYNFTVSDCLEFAKYRFKTFHSLILNTNVELKQIRKWYWGLLASAIIIEEIIFTNVDNVNEGERLMKLYNIEEAEETVCKHINNFCLDK